ncbi:MAG: pyridoxal phosphate-dependent aminotransferase [Silicimonas sp.]|nr:pyridoxal phosphate-dependent aminotransferase [Silicimonas sp.]
MTAPPETPLAQSLPATVPFVGPETLERQRGRPFRARIGANESVFGPSPRVIQAIRAAADQAWMYGDPENHDLREALARHLGIDTGEVVMGEGVDALLGYAVRLYVGAGDVVVTSDGAYPTFNYHVAGFGGDLVKVPYRDDKEDIEALLSAACDHKARMVYLANPDNPMGSWHDAGVIEAMVANLPADCMLILDEAYWEFAPDDAVPRIDINDPRVIRMRTFSKAYGMAGMRVGYAFGNADVIRGFEKIRNHFGMNRISQIAALAALADQDWIAEVCEKVDTARIRIGDIARQNGLVPLPSATNFVTLDCGGDAEFARTVLQELGKRDVFVRMPFAGPGNRCIRISAGRSHDLECFAEALPDALKAARGLG